MDEMSWMFVLVRAPVCLEQLCMFEVSSDAMTRWVLSTQRFAASRVLQATEYLRFRLVQCDMTLDASRLLVFISLHPYDITLTDRAMTS